MRRLTNTFLLFLMFFLHPFCPAITTSAQNGIVTKLKFEPRHGFYDLVKNEDYRLLFADRVQKHFFNGGPFSPESLIDSYRDLASEVEMAIIPESARWGDQHFATPLTQDDWYVERDWILNTYLPQRSDIVLNQFRKANLYPSIAAPVFQVNGVAQHGGDVTSADQISISATESIVYYTLDGSDPRLSSNSTSNNLIIVPEDMPKQVLVPQSAINQNWKSDTAFNITNWLLCQGKSRRRGL